MLKTVVAHQEVTNLIAFYQKQIARIKRTHRANGFADTEFDRGTRITLSTLEYIVYILKHTGDLEYTRALFKAASAVQPFWAADWYADAVDRVDDVLAKLHGA